MLRGPAPGREAGEPLPEGRRRALRGPAPAAAAAGGRPGAAGDRLRLPQPQLVPLQRAGADPQAGGRAQRHRPGTLQPLPEVPGRTVQQRERQALQPRWHLLPRFPRQPDEREEGGDGGHVQALRLPQRLAGQHHARPGGAQPHGQRAPREAAQHHQDHPRPHLQPHLPPLQELQHLPGGRQVRGQLQGQERLQEEAAGLPGAQKVRAGHRPGGTCPPTSSRPLMSACPGNAAFLLLAGLAAASRIPAFLFITRTLRWPHPPSGNLLPLEGARVAARSDPGRAETASSRTRQSIPEEMPGRGLVPGCASAIPVLPWGAGSRGGWRQGRTLSPTVGVVVGSRRTDAPEHRLKAVTSLEKGLRGRTLGSSGWQGRGDMGTRSPCTL